MNYRDDKFNVLKKHTYLFRAYQKRDWKGIFLLVSSCVTIANYMLARPDAEFDTLKLIEEISRHLSNT